MLCSIMRSDWIPLRPLGLLCVKDGSLGYPFCVHPALGLYVYSGYPAALSAMHRVVWFVVFGTVLRLVRLSFFSFESCPLSLASLRPTSDCPIHVHPGTWIG
nr:hypothetical protein Iba_chr01dCG0820 [Ipomoea batatas]